MAKLERDVRGFLNEWKVWVGIAYFGLAAVTVALWWWNGKVNHQAQRVARDEAVHAAEIQANTSARVQQCLVSRPELQKINRFIKGVQDAHQVLVQNSEAALAATDPADPVYTVRKQNLRRLQRSSADVDIRLFVIPTEAQCRHS